MCNNTGGALLLIIDGMTDENFDTQEMPYLNKIMLENEHGALLTTPAGFDAESYTCISTLLGVNANELPVYGRSWFEALGANVSVPNDALITRASWVELDENDVTTGLCAPPEALPELNARCYSLGGYRSLLVFDGMAKEIAQIQTFPPFAHIGEPISAMLPRGCANVENAAKLSKVGKKMLIPWGQAVKCTLPKIDTSAAAISATPLVLGICRAMGFKTFLPDGATGDTDTALENKLNLAASLLKTHEMVFLHINGADEAAHRKNAREKLEFLKKVDKTIISNIADLCSRALICSDHGTSPATGRHLGGAQPFALFGSHSDANVGTLPGCDGIKLLLKN